jgi:iron(III) transport system permease protein
MGKGSRSAPLALGKAKYPLLGFLIVFMTITVVIPMLVLLLDTVMLVPGVYSLSNFTLHYWIGERGGIDLFAGMPGVFRHPWFWESFRTTMLLTVCVAVIGMFTGQFLGYVCTRGRGRLSGRILEQCAFLPYMIPSVTFGALYLTMWIEPRLFLPSLYGTFALLVLICVVNGLPSASRAGTANMMQIGFDLEEAASIQGASFIRRFRKIVLPLAKPGFLTGFILIFMSTITTLDLIILLMSTNVTTLSYMVFSFSESGESAHASVLSAFMFLLVLITYLIAIKIGRVDLAAAYGGSSGGGKSK